MSFTNLNYHIVFATKDRRPSMSPELLPRICEYIAGVIYNHNGTPLIINGMPDHLHMAVNVAPTIALSDFVRDVKANASRWIHETFPDLQSFGWQNGYSAFTVSRSAKDLIVAYIAHQQEHHKTMTFQEELVALLDKHEIEYDERYI